MRMDSCNSGGWATDGCYSHMGMTAALCACSFVPKTAEQGGCGGGGYQCTFAQRV